MAKIRNYEVKSLKMFKGMEGTGVNANIYRSNKKVGSVVDDATGAPMMFDFINEKEEELFKQVGKDYLNRDSFMVDEVFVTELINLKELHGIFKKSLREGYGSIVVLTDENKKEYPKKVDKILSIPKNYNLNEEDKEDFEEMIQYKGEEDFILE